MNRKVQIVTSIRPARYSMNAEPDRDAIMTIRPIPGTRAVQVRIRLPACTKDLWKVDSSAANPAAMTRARTYQK
jgi:hypothetical protein